MWTLKAEKIGTYADTADLTYTKSVDVCDIYKDLGLGSKIEKKDVSVYVDGVVDPENKIVPVAITKDNDDDSYGANGVLTEVFYDDDADTITITQVNTYVGTIVKTVKATDYLQEGCLCCCDPRGCEAHQHEEQRGVRDHRFLR